MNSPLRRLAAAALSAATVILTATYAVLAASGGEAPPLGQLPSACREAKAHFRPLTETDLKEVRVELADAVARLERRLEAAGENGAAWNAFLQGDLLRAQLAEGRTPDLDVLDGVYKRYTAGHEGLELVWFLDVRETLRRYREMARTVGNPELPARYAQLLDFLADRLGAYAAGPTADDALVIGRVVRQLEEFGQATELVSAVRHHYLRPNLMLRVSADVAAAGIAERVDETAPVHEVILGTDIYGTGHTTGRVKVELLPDQRRGVLEAVFRGAVQTQNVGYHGPVTICSNGSARVGARKRLWIDAEGVGSRPTASDAITRTEITGISSRRGSRLVEKMAWKRACKQKSEAECIASRRTERRINQRIDQQAGESIDRANQAFLERFRRPLLERGLFPRQLRFATTRTDLHVVSLQADPFQLGAPTDPPELPGQFDLALLVHESMINNLATSALSGMTLRDEGFEAAMVDIFGELPEPLQADEDQEGWGIAFSSNRQPISVAFAENGFRVTVRGRTFYKGEESYPGMDVTADYKIFKTEQGFKAVRDEDLRILPPGVVSGGRKLSPREVVIRTLLQRRFGKIFRKEMRGEGFVLPGKWSGAGKMNPVLLACENGWLTVAWRRGLAGAAVARTGRN